MQRKDRVNIMRKLYVISLLFLVLCSCAVSPRTQIGKPAAPVTAAVKGWWYARFQIQWPEDSKPSWYIDAAIADQVIKPALRTYETEIDLWRFHRRAVRDDVGHQFSFIFYTNQQSANLIYSNIKENPFLQLLQSGGQVVKVRYDDTSVIKKPNIQDTSDPRWSIEVQKSWPYFIMGASNMWLDILDQLWNEYEQQHPSLTFETQLEAYHNIYDSLTYLWQEECGHALLHHLYALFGYVPVKVRKADLLMRF